MQQPSKIDACILIQLPLYNKYKQKTRNKRLKDEDYDQSKEVSQERNEQMAEATEFKAAKMPPTAAYYNTRF